MGRYCTSVGWVWGGGGGLDEYIFDYSSANPWELASGHSSRLWYCTLSPVSRGEGKRGGGGDSMHNHLIRGQQQHSGGA